MLHMRSDVPTEGGTTKPDPNGCVQIDPFDVMDANGNRHWLVLRVDVATNYVTMVLLTEHSLLALWRA